MVVNRIGTGILVGSIVAALAWRGNSGSNVVSVFPDGLTSAVLVISLFLAIRLELGRSRVSDRQTVWLAGLTIATSAGVIHGVATLVLGLLRFSQPLSVLLTFGFLAAVASSVAAGAAATKWFSHRQVHQAV
jgi:hypothetical protein